MSGGVGGSSRKVSIILLYLSITANLYLFVERSYLRSKRANYHEGDSPHRTIYQNTIQMEKALLSGEGGSSGQCIQAYGPGGCVDVWPSYHYQRLTHIVMPFHTSQVSRVEANLHSWSEYPPCTAAMGGAHPNGPFHLVLYSSADSRKRQYIVELEQRLQAAIGNMTADALACFQSIEIQHANLSGPSDTYYRGTRLMIEKLILQKVRLQYPPQYVFYMEPDCLPIRSNWLNALDLSVRWPNAPFWMKGSIYRGHNKAVYATRHPPQVFHINGNAIYNIGDRAFKNFYVKHYRPYVNSVSKSKERSFDTDFYRFIHDIDNVMVTRSIIHKFQYSEVVQNYWRSSFSVAKLRNDNPGTYLIHGGYPKA